MSGKGIWAPIFLVVLCLCGSFAIAQTSATGALSGTVSDQTGAIVANANVTLTSVDTGQVRSSMTGSDGTYKFGFLQPGNYKVKFEAPGFKSVEIPSTKVTVTETQVLDWKLEVGAQSQEVVVQAEAETIQTATSTLGTVVNSKAVTDLPLNTRNYTNLLSLSAGANANVQNASAIGKGTQSIATNGSSTGSNNYQMDGVSIVNFNSVNDGQESGTHGAFGIPNPDSIQEFKIQTSQYDASYGQMAGANVNVVTKSGSNAFHGAAWEFLRNTSLNANDWFRNNAGKPRGRLDQNQYGGTFGGPVKKDKLFFFVSYQETGQKNGVATGGASSPVLPAIPTIDRSNGTSLRAALGALYSGKTGALTTPFAAGVPVASIKPDGSNISPVALAILQLKLGDGSYYIPSTGSTNPNVPTVFPLSFAAIYHEHQAIGNWDYLINPKHTLSGRYFFASDPQTLPFPNGAISLTGFPSTPQWNNHEAVLKLTSIVTNTFVNEVRGSFQRNISIDAEGTPFTANQVGMTPDIPSLPVLPSITVLNQYVLGAYNFGIANNSINQYQLADQISWTHGKHTVRAGFEATYYQWNWNFPGLAIGGFTFNSFPDFLLGLPGCAPGTAAAACTTSTNAGTTNGTAQSNIASVSGSSTKPIDANGLNNHYRARDYSGFLQDDFKVSSRLTLNLGVRWEFDTPVWENNGKNTNVFPSLVKTSPYPVVSGPTGCAGVVFPSPCVGGSYVGFVIPSNYNLPIAVPPGVFQNNQVIATRSSPPKDNFAPRVGFAWQPSSSNKLVVRGGVGIFFERLPGEDFIHSVLQQVPYTQTIALSGASNFASSFAVPFTTQPVGWIPRWYTTSGLSSNLNSQAIQENFPTPEVYQWSLNTQYEFLPHWVMEIGYVGSRGVHQFLATQPLNPPQLATPSNPVNCGYNGGDPTNPANCITTTTGSNASIRVPFLGFFPGFSEESAGGDFKYNSLQATVRKQFSRGLQLQAAYTFSRAFVATFAGQNANNPLVERYQPNPAYHPHRLALSYSYALPIPEKSGVVGKIVNGWTASGVTTIQAGVPLTITDTTAGGAYGNFVTSNAQYAAGMGPDNVGTSGSVEDRVLNGIAGGTGYLNKAAFTPAPIVGTDGVARGYGNSAFGIILGPGQNNWDVSLEKITKVGGLRENAELRFRTEFFNAFNHAQFSSPAVNFGSAATFGRITSTSVNPRLIQFALKYIF